MVDQTDTVNLNSIFFPDWNLQVKSEKYTIQTFSILRDFIIDYLPIWRVFLCQEPIQDLSGEFYQPYNIGHEE